jgi:hypothetical protein
MQMHAKCKLTVKLLAFSWLYSLSVLSAQASVGPVCNSKVYIYVDFSDSISAAQKKLLASALGKILADGRPGPITDKKVINLIQFGNRVGPAKIVDKEAASEIASEIAIWMKSPVKVEDFDRQQSNVLNVLLDIEKRILSDSKAHSVFVVASDFKHDSSRSDTERDRKNDLEDWRENWPKLLERLRPNFKPPEGAVLLLLPVGERDASLQVREIRNWVLDKGNGLRALVPYENQIKVVGELLDLGDFLSYMKPISIETKIADGRFEIEVVNRSCFKLPSLRLKKFVILPEKKGEVELTSMITSIPEGLSEPHQEEYLLDDIRKEISRIAGPRSGVSAHMPEIRAVVEVADGEVDVILQKLAVQDVNIDEFVFLSSFIGRPDAFNQDLKVAATFAAALWTVGSGEMATIELHSAKRGIVGRGEVELDKGAVELDGSGDLNPLSRKREFGLDVDDNYLSSICTGSEDLGPLSVMLKLPKNRDLLLIQKKNLPAYATSDGARGMLDSLIQQGSLPALMTIASLFVLIIGHRRLTMGKIEEILAATGLFWVTIFFLVRRFTVIGAWTNALLFGVPACVIGCLISVFIIGVGALILLRKSLVPSPDDLEGALGLAKRMATLRGVVVARSQGKLGRFFESAREWSRKRFGRFVRLAFLGLAFSILIVMPFVFLVFQVVELEDHFSGIKSDCIIEASDQLSD